MNINKNISKLLYALSIKNKLYKINTFKFYSDKANKYCTKYQILKKEEIELYDADNDEIITQERYKSDYECYSKVEVMKYLISEYKEGEANGI